MNYEPAYGRELNVLSNPVLEILNISKDERPVLAKRMALLMDKSLTTVFKEMASKGEQTIEWFFSTYGKSITTLVTSMLQKIYLSYNSQGKT